MLGDRSTREVYWHFSGGYHLSKKFFVICQEPEQSFILATFNILLSLGEENRSSDVTTAR